MISRGRSARSTPKTEEFLDLPRDQMVGQPVDRALSRYPGLLDLIRKTMADPQNVTVELEFTGPDDNRIFMETAISTMGRQGEQTGMILVILRDVTQSRMLERHLSRSDRLVSIGTLAAGVAP